MSRHRLGAPQDGNATAAVRPDPAQGRRGTTGISYDAEDAARVAELLLAAGRPELIQAYSRRGILPETVEREMMAQQPDPKPRPWCSVRA